MDFKPENQDKKSIHADINFPAKSLSVQGRGGVLRSQVQWGKELPGSFGVIREIRRHRERQRLEPIACFGAARESGSLDTSRPAQPVEQCGFARRALDLLEIQKQSPELWEATEHPSHQGR